MVANKISTITSAKIANMGIVCAFLIVLNHLHPQMPTGSILWWMDHILGNHGLSAIAVPYFFVAAGYLMSGHIGEDHWWRKEVFKRIHSLVVPFFIWNLVYFIWGYVKLFSLNSLAGRPILAHVACSVHGVLCALGFDVFHQPAAGQLWFVRALFIFIVMSPLLKFLARWYGLLILMLLYVFICPWPTEWVEASSWRLIFRWFFSLEGVFYFVVGMMLRLEDVNLNCRRLLSVVFLFMGFVFLSMAAWGDLCCWTGACYFRITGIPFALIGVWGIMPIDKWVTWLVQSSFSVYLVHGIVVSIIGLFASRIAFLNFIMNTVLGWWLWGVGAFAISLLVTLFVRKKMKTLSPVLFGGR